MTCLEKLRKDHPAMSEIEVGFKAGNTCPSDYGYAEAGCCDDCRECWNYEIPEKKEVTDGCFAEDGYSPKLTFSHTGEAMAKIKDIVQEHGGIVAHVEPIIKDSGDRTEFETGAVRDMREGKGRCDLMPLEVVGNYICESNDETDNVLWAIRMFQKTNSTSYLYSALNSFDERSWDNCYTMFLEVAKHFEEGAKKYGESNWQLGIPVHCYINSAVRHYLKWLRGDTDEHHNRAFVWNLMCCIWEVDYRNKEEK